MQHGRATYPDFPGSGYSSEAGLGKIICGRQEGPILRDRGQNAHGCDGEVIDGASKLFPGICGGLQRLATARLSQEKPDQTMHASALVHEAWLRIAGLHGHPWRGRGEYFCAAAQAMQRILVETARRKKWRKSMQGGDRVSLECVVLASTYRTMTCSPWTKACFTSLSINLWPPACARMANNRARRISRNRIAIVGQVYDPPAPPPTVRPGSDADRDVDQGDYGHLQRWYSGLGAGQYDPACHTV